MSEVTIRGREIENPAARAFLLRCAAILVTLTPMVIFFLYFIGFILFVFAFVLTLPLDLLLRARGRQGFSVPAADGEGFGYVIGRHGFKRR